MCKASAVASCFFEKFGFSFRGSGGILGLWVRSVWLLRLLRVLVCRGEGLCTVWLFWRLGDEGGIRVRGLSFMKDRVFGWCVVAWLRAGRRSLFIGCSYSSVEDFAWSWTKYRMRKTCRNKQKQPHKKSRGCMFSSFLCCCFAVAVFACCLGTMIIFHAAVIVFGLLF